MYSFGSPSASPHPATSSKHHLFVRLAFGFTSPCYFLKTSSIRSARLRLHLTLLLPQNIIYSFGSPSASPHPATSSKHLLFVPLPLRFPPPYTTGPILPTPDSSPPTPARPLLPALSSAS